MLTFVLKGDYDLRMTFDDDFEHSNGSIYTD
jgi:hypothetical protein